MGTSREGQKQGEIEDQLTCRGAAALGNFLKNPLVSRAFITIGIITMPGMAMPTLERVTRPGSPPAEHHHRDALPSRDLRGRHLLPLRRLQHDPWGLVRPQSVPPWCIITIMATSTSTIMATSTGTSPSPSESSVLRMSGMLMELPAATATKGTRRPTSGGMEPTMALAPRAVASAPPVAAT